MTADAPDSGRAAWLHPATWGIPMRSALAAGLVVLLAFLSVGAAVIGILHAQVLADVDAAADRRARDVAVGLQGDSPRELDSQLLLTDAQIGVIQVVDPSGAVVRASDGGPRIPLIDRAGTQRSATVDGVDVRVSSQPAGQYTVLVGARTDPGETTVWRVALLLAAAMPVVVAGAAAATFVLVRRSLKSVEAIRAQVAEISSHDLSERVAVPAHRDEIAALAVTMNDMLARIDAGHAAQRRFVGDASHELRSPLSTIISALEVGAAHPELLKLELVDNALLPEANRMRSLIDDLLLLARADELGIPVRREDVDLDDVVAQEVTRVAASSVHSVLTGVVPVRVSGDPQALARVLRNLLENAVRHCRSRVEVSLRAAGGTATLIVSDDGPGIPDGERARVFERFVRLDSDRSRSSGGSGLGLAIVAEIVAAHNGSVTVRDSPQGGAAIVVQLPVSDESMR
ncbi:MAG: HAMP domain-containing histidine kinase [Mycobacterium sp.]|nr:HAMP domain-containing histidine kinase [Mycobacterium sp.]